jgi:osmoprotectant transport system ATP-binding protein
VRPPSAEPEHWVIELVEVSKKYGARVAVANLSLRIEAGTLTVLIGPSGCGKTTTLKMINRLITPDSGDVKVHGRSIAGVDPVTLRRGIGYVIQDVGLFPHLSVAENISVVPRLLKWPRPRIEDRVREVLDLVTLDPGFAPLYPHELSGGERQRVGLARALSADPDILLMDEPFGAIDPINRARLQDMLLDVQERIRKTVVFVTHDINEAIKLGDRIAVLRDGALVQHDSAARLLLRPADSFVEQLLGRDRNLKALALKRARDFAATGGYVVAPAAQDDGALAGRLAEAGVSLALLVDGEGRLESRLVRNGDGRTRRDTQPVAVDRNANLNEVLSAMLMAGENLLPVVDGRGRIVGTIGLSTIFAQFVSQDEGPRD